MPELERWVLHRLAELDRQVRQNVEDFDFHALYQAVYTFCAVDLSAFYFDVRKDVLYCDRPDSLRRRACRTVLDELFSCLTAWGSEERRVGKECVGTCRSRWSRYHKKKK